MPGLDQGHNQKKDTHTLDFDVSLSVVRCVLLNIKENGNTLVSQADL